jgi:hypothetical protein
MSYIPPPEGPQFKGRECAHPGRECRIVEEVEPITAGNPIMLVRYCALCGRIRVREPLEARRASLLHEGWLQL